MPMQSIISRLVDSDATISSNSKVIETLNRWVGIPEVSNISTKYYTHKQLSFKMSRYVKLL
jgi:hypothetical protein